MHQLAEVFERGVLGAARGVFEADAARGVFEADAVRGVFGAAAGAAEGAAGAAEGAARGVLGADAARGVFGAVAVPLPSEAARGVFGVRGVEAGTDADREVEAEAVERDEDPPNVFSFLRWRNASSAMARFSRDFRTLFMRTCPGMSCERSMMSKVLLTWLAGAVESGSTSQTNSSDMSSSDPKRSEIELASLDSDRASSCRSSVGSDIAPVFAHRSQILLI